MCRCNKQLELEIFCFWISCRPNCVYCEKKEEKPNWSKYFQWPCSPSYLAYASWWANWLMSGNWDVLNLCPQKSSNSRVPLCLSLPQDWLCFHFSALISPRADTRAPTEVNADVATLCFRLSTRHQCIWVFILRAEGLSCDKESHVAIPLQVFPCFPDLLQDRSAFESTHLW